MFRRLSRSSYKTYFACLVLIADTLIGAGVASYSMLSIDALRITFGYSYKLRAADSTPVVCFLFRELPEFPVNKAVSFLVLFLKARSLLSVSLRIEQ